MTFCFLSRDYINLLCVGKVVLIKFFCSLEYMKRNLLVDFYYLLKSLSLGEL